MYLQPVTKISDLPDVDTLDSQGMQGMHSVRPTSISESKYRSMNDPSNQTPNPNFQRHHESSGMNYTQPYQDLETPPPMQIPMEQNFEIENTSHMEPTCLQCAAHADSCPICKTYFNNDKTVYIVVILFLSILCMLLLKKILNV